MNGKEKIINRVIYLTFIMIALMSFWAYIKDASFNKDFLSPESISLNLRYDGSDNNRKASILVLGDMMLDRNVRNTIDEIGFDDFFSGVKDLISRPDIAVANLEGPFTPYQSVTADLRNKALQFTFDPALTPKLSKFGFDVFDLANNHTMNFGSAGMAYTRSYIKESGMEYYGDPNNKREISYVSEKNGLKIGFVGFHEFSYVNFDKVFDEIKRLRPEVDVLVITPHWGIEYEKIPTDKIRELAHKFIDLGADMVVGSHSHVVGEIENYKNKKIYYSLGNFVFDQYFSEDTMNGLGVMIFAEKDALGHIRLSYENIPINITSSGPIAKI